MDQLTMETRQNVERAITAGQEYAAKQKHRLFARVPAIFRGAAAARWLEAELELINAFRAGAEWRARSHDGAAS